MSFSVNIGLAPKPHAHHHHHGHHHHYRPHRGFFRFPKFPTFHFPRFYFPRPAPSFTPAQHIPVTPLSETGRKFVNIGAASVAAGVIMTVVGACLAPVSFGATGALCGIGGALILGGIGAVIYGHLHG